MRSKFNQNKPDSAYIDEEELDYLAKNFPNYIRGVPELQTTQPGKSPVQLRKFSKPDYSYYVFSADPNIAVNLKDDVHNNDSYKCSGLQNAKMQKLQTGKLPRRAEVDLHGMDIAQAAQAVADLVNYAYAHGYECIRVIHGKGQSARRYGYSAAVSPGIQGKLKHYLLAWLKNNEVILGFCRALPNDGGSGASYILLKTKS